MSDGIIIAMIGLGTSAIGGLFTYFQVKNGQRFKALEIENQGKELDVKVRLTDHEIGEKIRDELLEELERVRIRCSSCEDHIAELSDQVDELTVAVRRCEAERDLVKARLRMYEDPDDPWDHTPPG